MVRYSSFLRNIETCHCEGELTLDAGHICREPSVVPYMRLPGASVFSPGSDNPEAVTTASAQEIQDTGSIGKRAHWKRNGDLQVQRIGDESEYPNPHELEALLMADHEKLLELYGDNPALGNQNEFSSLNLRTPNEVLMELLVQPSDFSEAMELEDVENKIDTAPYDLDEANIRFSDTSGDLRELTENLEDLIPLVRNSDDSFGIQDDLYDLTHKSRMASSSPHSKPLVNQDSSDRWQPSGIQIRSEKLLHSTYLRSGQDREYGIIPDGNHPLLWSLPTQSSRQFSRLPLPCWTTERPVPSLLQRDEPTRSQLAGTSTELRGFWRQNNLY